MSTPPAAPFYELLAARLNDMKSDVDPGVGVQAELARELTRRGVQTTKQAVNDWCHGRARPEPWKWSTLLDALGIPFTDRKRWDAALTAKRETRADAEAMPAPRSSSAA